MKTHEMPGELVLDNELNWTKLYGFKIRLHIVEDGIFTVLDGPRHQIFLHDDYFHANSKRTGEILGEFKTFEEALAACRKEEVHHAD